jgi:hypothetical protein
MTDRRCPHITHRTGCKLLCMQAAVNAELKPATALCCSKIAEAEAARLLLFAYLQCERPITWAVSSAVCCHHDYICSMCFFVLQYLRFYTHNGGLQGDCLPLGDFCPHCTAPLHQQPLSSQEGNQDARHAPRHTTLTQSETQQAHGTTAMLI